MVPSMEAWWDLHRPTESRCRGSVIHTYTRCIVIVARYNKQSRWKDLIISVTAVGREVNPVIIPDTGNTYTWYGEIDTT